MHICMVTWTAILMSPNDSLCEARVESEKVLCGNTYGVSPGLFVQHRKRKSVACEKYMIKSIIRDKCSKLIDMSVLLQFATNIAGLISGYQNFERLHLHLLCHFRNIPLHFLMSPLHLIHL